MSTVAISGWRRVQEVAEEYRRRGYNVAVEPVKEQLPDFLAPYRPNLIAHRENEWVVIEVKSRTALAQADYLRNLAGAVEKQPGWRFELVVSDTKASSAEEVANSMDRQDVFRTFEEVEELLQLNRVEAALLLAWSASEAAFRLLATEEGISLERHDALYLLKQLATYAVISQDDYNALVQRPPIRSA